MLLIWWVIALVIATLAIQAACEAPKTAQRHPVLAMMTAGLSATMAMAVLGVIGSNALILAWTLPLLFIAGSGGLATAVRLRRGARLA